MENTLQENSQIKMERRRHTLLFIIIFLKNNIL